jgi:hypothetical protein
MNPEDPIQSSNQPINQSTTPTPPVPEISPTAASTEVTPITESASPVMHEIPKKKNGFVVFLVILLALISVGSLGYWAYQKYFAPSPSASPKPSAQEVIPTATPDLTANWKTYTNSKYGYSFKYPEIWIDVSDPASTTEFRIETSSKEVIIGTVFAGKADTSKDQVWMKTLAISSTQYLKISYMQCAGMGCKEGFKDVATFDQILSTFKFLSTTSTDERATLTQYLIDRYYAQSQKYGYSRDQIQITIGKIEGNFAIGSSKIDDAGGDGWYATKVNGQWKIVEQTQEPPSCALMAEYNFPKSIYGECVNK